jgi:hypothetical protein
MMCQESSHLQVEEYVNNAEELQLGTNPDNADTDGDGVGDSLKERLRQRQELNSHTDPFRRESPSPQWKELGDRVRAYDLETVAAHLGLEPDTHDKHK